MELQKNIAVLGASGFVGQHVAAYFDRCPLAISKFNRPLFDYVMPTSFRNFNITDVTVFDCIANIDTTELLHAVNVEGFKKFLSYLIENKTEGNFVYFSTTSVSSPNLVETNPYVRSKFEAENILRTFFSDYKIIRLTFPFGMHEGRNRLLSRLFFKLSNGGDLKLDDSQLCFTPIEVLCNRLKFLIQSSEKELDFICSQPIALRRVVEIMREVISDEGKFDLPFLESSYTEIIRKAYLTTGDIEVALRRHFTELWRLQNL